MMPHSRVALALAALSAATLSGSAAADPVPPVLGWFKLPSREVAPVVSVGGPGIAPGTPVGAPGLIADYGEDFEVVKLKYADVSEIVGLLTGNQNIKSNDDFTPQEPNFG